MPLSIIISGCSSAAVQLELILNVHQAEENIGMQQRRIENEDNLVYLVFISPGPLGRRTGQTPRSVGLTKLSL